MVRFIIKLKDDTIINIPADEIEFRGSQIIAWAGNCIAAIVKASEIKVCYLSTQKN